MLYWNRLFRRVKEKVVVAKWLKKDRKVARATELFKNQNGGLKMEIKKSCALKTSE